MPATALRHLAAALALLALSCLLAGAGGTASLPAENPAAPAPWITLKQGATIIPVTIPAGLDLQAAARANRQAAIILRGIRADGPTNGGFTVRVVGIDEPIGNFNTFSLVGKLAGENRSFIPADPSGFLQALARQPADIRLRIDAPADFSEQVTLEGADLVVE